MYFLVAEALTNATRHGRPDTINVEVTTTGDVVRTVVTDDGVGGARLVPGGGLSGLVERINALGGEVTVHGDPCAVHVGAQGTTVTAVMSRRAVKS
jgi:signal transduction histidine kinase